MRFIVILIIIFCVNFIHKYLILLSLTLRKFFLKNNLIFNIDMWFFEILIEIER